MSSPSKRVEIGLKEREDEYIQYKQYHVLVGTFNVNNRQAPPNVLLKQWFSQLTDKDETYVPDIITVGFQEIDTSGGAYIYDDKRKENEWQDLVSRTIQACYGDNTKANVEFFLLKQVRLIGILLFVYVRSDHKQKCTYVSSSSVPTGFFGIAGNKGGVGIRFRFYESDICFINSHFASGDGQTARRNNDYQTIESTMAFTDGPTYSLKDYFWYTPGAAVGNVNPSPNTTTSHQWWKINDHDVIFWCGDMNYRISQANEQVRQAITERSTVPLHEKDQLRCEMKLQNVFMGYYEPPIEFMPTYKFDPNTEVYDTSEKLRTPSWTDRILYRSKRLKVKMNNETEVDTIKTIEYSSANEIRFSDHRPVSGLYAVTIKFACDEKRSNQIREELNRMSDRFENEAIPTIEVYPRPPEIKFSNVRYLDKPSYPLTIKNIGECVCSCTIQPSSLSPSFQYVICSPAPPFVIDVKGEQHVNISFNARLRKESISEILILHVENGADKFITLDLTFDNGPFGLALNEYPPTFYDNDTKKHIYSTEKPSTSQHIVEMINDPPVLYIALIETLKDRSDVNLLYIFSNETQDSLDVIPIRDQIYQHHYDFSKYSTAEIFMILVHLLQSLKDPLISFEIQDAIFSNSAQLTDSSRAVSILVEQLKGKERSLFFRLLVLLKTFWPTKEQIEKTDDEAGDAFNVCIDILALSIFHEHLDRTQRHACILACLNEEKKP